MVQHAPINTTTESLYLQLQSSNTRLHKNKTSVNVYTVPHCRPTPNAGSILAHCPRRLPNIQPTLGQRLVFAGDIPLQLSSPYTM